MASFMGKGAWWSVPLAVLLGIPMYSNAAGIIPVVHDHTSQGSQAPPDSHFCGSRGLWNIAGGIPVQFVAVDGCSVCQVVKGAGQKGG